MSIVYSKRLASTRKAMRTNRLDGMIVTGLANVRFLCGYSGSSGLLWITRHASVFFTDFRYQEQAKREVKASQKVIIQKSLLDDLLATPSVAKARRIGYESGHLLCSQLDRLSKGIPAKRLVPTSGLMESARLVKDVGELHKIAKAASIADRAFSAIQKFIKPGVSERAVANQLDYYLKRFGADKPSFDSIVASGPNSALPHAQPGERRFRRGDFLVLDFGARHQGYCSDMTRTVCIGKPTDRHLEIYRLVHRSQAQGLRAVRPGVRGREADGAARAVIEGAGYGKYFGHGLGHGVGLEVHEGPRLGKTSEDVLRPGHVVTVEPGVYLPGWGGVRIEDLVAVTERGCRVLSGSTKKLISIE
jgi:Xaa-Pro aminopeptidase